MRVCPVSISAVVKPSIVLNPAFFRAGVKALDANDYIVYNKANGVLSYDADGSGAHAAIAFAVLVNRPVLAANDFVVI